MKDHEITRAADRIVKDSFVRTLAQAEAEETPEERTRKWRKQANEAGRNHIHLHVVNGRTVKFYKGVRMDCLVRKAKPQEEPYPQQSNSERTKLHIRNKIYRSYSNRRVG